MNVGNVNYKFHVIYADLSKLRNVKYFMTSFPKALLIQNMYIQPVTAIFPTGEFVLVVSKFLSSLVGTFSIRNNVCNFHYRATCC